MWRKYWIMAQDERMPKGLKNGLHLVEARIDGDAVLIKRPNALRASRIHMLRWMALKRVEFTGQTFGSVLQQFHTSKGENHEQEKACPVDRGTDRGSAGEALAPVQRPRPRVSARQGRPARRR